VTTTIERPAISLEYFEIAITAAVTLTAQPVEFAFVPDGDDGPADDDWTAATWIGDAGLTRAARLLLGPGGDVTLAVGGYVPWYRVTDDPEIPARPVGWLSVT
jgi:hypothetical protein